MRNAVQNLAAGWNHFWFTPTDPTTLAALRIATGLVLFYVYATTTPDLLDFVGPHAWTDARAIEQIHRGGAGSNDLALGPSVWFFVQNPTAIYFVHAAFLLAIVSFTLGFWTRTMSVVVWLGHLSFVHRAVLSWSGMDTILAMLTFYLMFAPSGLALSVDSRRQPCPGESVKTWAGNVVVRLIQIHMCIVYLCAGLSKLQGAHWWDGTAMWRAMLLQEFAPFDVSWLGHLGDGPCLLLSNVGVALTLFMEISFAFLIWNPKVRPVLLTLAVLLHCGIGVFMGLGSFGAAMLTGCVAFVSPETVRTWADWCQRRLRTWRSDAEQAPHAQTAGLAKRAA